MDRNLGLGQRWGLEGYFAEIEWKLIIRHKRTRYYLFMSGLFLFYGLLYYGDAVEKDYPFMLVLVALMLMTNFTSQYATNFFSWNSAFFEFYLTKPYGLRALLQGKLILLKYLIVLIFILCLPYLYFGWQVLAVHLAMAFFAMGVAIYLFSWLGISNSFKIDLSQSGTAHGNGLGILGAIILFGLVSCIVLIIFTFQYLGWKYLGYTFVGMLGFVGVLLFSKVADLLNQKAQRKRYYIIDQFNKKT